MELGAGIGPGETGEGNKGAGAGAVASKGRLVLRWLIICGDWLQTIGSSVYYYYIFL